MVPVTVTAPDLNHYQDMVKVIRLTNNVFFGNVEALKETFYQFLPHGQSNLRAIVLDGAGKQQMGEG